MFLPHRVLEHWNRLSCPVVTAGGAQEAFGQHSWAQGVILVVSCAGPGVGLHDPDGCLLTQHILTSQASFPRVFVLKSLFSFL